MNDSEEAARFQKLVEELHEPWSRRAARRKLVAAGAVEPLLECLQSHNDSVVWAAVESLGELRATEAVGPLVDLLERGTLALDVVEALTTITGQRFGASVSQWRQWMADSPAGGPPPFDTAGCIRQTGQYLGVEPSGSGKSYRFRLSLADGRMQKVAVYFGREDHQGHELIVIYSECGPAKAKFFETVLRKNLALPSGAFGIRDIDGKPHLVMVDTMYAASATASVLARKIENIASRADLAEKGLTKEDRR